MSTYKKGTFEHKINSLLSNADSYRLVAHCLLNDGWGWSVNDSFTMAQAASRENAIAILRDRWEIFKLNYAPKARVQDIEDTGTDEGEHNFEVDGIPFADVFGNKV